MLYLLLVSAIWAASFSLIKTHLVSVQPDLVNAIRLLLSLAVFLPFLKREKLNRQTLGQLLLIGGIQFGAMYAFYTRAFGSLSAHQAALATIMTPLYVIVLEDVLTRRFRLFPYACALLAVLGTAISIGLSGKTQAALDPTALHGILLIQASNFCFATGQIAFRRTMAKNPELPNPNAFAWCALGAFLVGLCAALPALAKASLPTLSQTQMVVLLYLGVIASGLCFFGWNLGARQASIRVLAVMNNLKIPAAMLVAFIFFGERTHWLRLAVGSSLILLALWLATKGHFKWQEKPYESKA